MLRNSLVSSYCLFCLAICGLQFLTDLPVNHLANEQVQGAVIQKVLG